MNKCSVSRCADKGRSATSTMSSGLQRALEFQDFFGHPIRFNFNEKGGLHSTWYGGLASLGIRGAMVIYVILFINRMTNIEETFNHIQTHEQYEPSGPDSSHSHHINATDIMFSLSIIDMSKQQYVEYDEELKRIIKVEAT